ncbi:MAG: hypothetical protein K8S23_10445 [Candidatus Cloacimonetes bacterium]|nr:hypothetical protein [Candidatus Cloacimonadota bacterium]
MRNIKNIVLITILFTSIYLHAGRFAGDFLEIGSGVRALGMGGAFVAVADDASTIYWNAAGISQLDEAEINIMRAYLYDGLAYYDNLTYCQPLPNNVTIGLNWTRLTIDEIPLFPEEELVYNVDMRSSFPDLNLSGQPNGFFMSTDDIFQFAFSKHIHYDINFGWLFFKLPLDLHFGGNIKYIKRKIFNNLGKGTGFDFSVLTKTDLKVLTDQDWMGELAFGFNFQDVGGTVITWDTESNHEDEILFNTKIGFAFFQPLEFINSELIFSIDKDYVYEAISHYGAELNYNNIISARLGYYDSNFSTGMSIKLYNFNVDYAFVTNVLGNTNRVGLRIYF